jgi:hypothetical protein
MYIFFDVLATPNSAIFGLFQSFYIFFRVDGRSQVFSRPYNAYNTPPSVIVTLHLQGVSG